MLLGFIPTGGQTNDCTQAIPPLGERRPVVELADKGYDTDPLLGQLAECRIRAVIPPRSMRKIQRDLDERSFVSATA